MENAYPTLAIRLLAGRNFPRQMNDFRFVQINVYATLRQYVGGRRTVETQVEPGTEVGALLGRIGIPVEMTRIIFVDHCAADLGRELSGGEVIAIFPPLGGG